MRGGNGLSVDIPLTRARYNLPQMSDEIERQEKAVVDFLSDLRGHYTEANIMV